MFFFRKLPSFGPSCWFDCVGPLHQARRLDPAEALLCGSRSLHSAPSTRRSPGQAEPGTEVRGGQATGRPVSGVLVVRGSGGLTSGPGTQLPWPWRSPGPLIPGSRGPEAAIWRGRGAIRWSLCRVLRCQPHGPRPLPYGEPREGKKEIERSERSERERSDNV